MFKIMLMVFWCDEEELLFELLFRLLLLSFLGFSCVLMFDGLSMVFGGLIVFIMIGGRELDMRVYLIRLSKVVRRL